MLPRQATATSYPLQVSYSAPSCTPDADSSQPTGITEASYETVLWVRTDAAANVGPQGGGEWLAGRENDVAVTWRFEVPHGDEGQ
jgi:hypothetical protein